LLPHARYVYLYLHSLQFDHGHDLNTRNTYNKITTLLLDSTPKIIFVTLYTHTHTHTQPLSSFLLVETEASTRRHSGEVIKKSVKKRQESEKFAEVVAR
jgi:hypothetical protein